MDKIKIIGGYDLEGQVNIAGAKNAVLPIMAAALLSDDGLTLHNVPDLLDVHSMNALLQSLGATITQELALDDSISLHSKFEEINHVADYELVRKMRSSILVLGPLLAKHKKAMVSLPGGCAIGARPVDLHIKGMEALGAKIKIENGYIVATSPKNGLIGAEIIMPKVTVTGTENIMMAATLAQGKTRIINAACEPEVVDLGKCLVAMGARIRGLGSNIIEIEGVEKLHHTQHHIIADRLEAGSYAFATGMCGGSVELLGIDEALLPNVIDYMRAIKIKVDKTDKGLMITRTQGRLRSADIITAPYPGFPTDLQAQFMAMMTVAEGKSVICEAIFENRFMHVPELIRMGADIQINGDTAIIKGVDRLHGAQVMATDLRASISLVMAGLSAEGATIVNRIYHLQRGYEKIEQKLSALGAKISIIKESSQQKGDGEKNDTESDNIISEVA